DNYDPLLLPGMYMNALVEVKQQKAPSLPDAAVVRWQNKYYVFLATANNEFIMTEVHHRDSSDGFTAVAPVGAAWKEDAQFVTANAYTLLMKLKNSAEEE
ncbi:MAG: efflux transporter periplasmic adaptor subunit, partial [Chitinophagaceae bacterium]